MLLSAQGSEPGQDLRVVSTTPDTMREVIHTFNRDGFDPCPAKRVAALPHALDPHRPRHTLCDRVPTTQPRPG